MKTNLTLILTVCLITACGSGSDPVTHVPDSYTVTAPPAQIAPPLPVDGGNPFAPTDQPGPTVEPVAQEITEPDPIPAPEPDSVLQEQDGPTIEPVINEPDPVPAPVTLVETLYFVEAMHLGPDWRFNENTSVVESWTEASMILFWEPLEDYSYSLVYDGELAPGQITSPWTVVAEFPISYDVFQCDSLPTIQVHSCSQGECITSEPIAWSDIPQCQVQ